MKWTGPFEVIDKIGEFDYKVKLDDGRVKMYHMNMLKKDINRKRSEANTVEDQALAAVATVVNDGDKGFEEKNKPHGKDQDYFVGRSKLNGKDVKCWYNPRMSTVVIKRELVNWYIDTGCAQYTILVY